MSSFTVTLTGRNSELHSSFFPPIELEGGAGDWEAGLTSFDSYFSIPNLVEGENSTLYLLDEGGHAVHDKSGRFVDDKDIQGLLNKQG